jgi:MHS family proline/betaine transporter-like MFS transporter
MRPLGAVYLGNLGDTIGRRTVMSLTLVLMTAGMLIVAFMPTYESIGIAAPVGIVIGRMMQGFSAGGEYGNSTALLAEQNPARRGFITSWQTATQGFAMMLAALSAAALTAGLDRASLESWGWRLPFIFGALAGPVGIYIRRHADESPEFADDAHARRPMLDLLKSQKLPLLAGALLIVLATVAIWLAVFMPAYTVKQYKLDPTLTFLGTAATGATIFLLSPFIGAMSDRYGRMPSMAAAIAVNTVVTVPLFSMLSASPSPGTLLTVQIGLGMIVALYFAPLPALMAELFPWRTRTSGLSLSYSLGVTIFGGFAPFIVTSLQGATGDPRSPGYYLIFGGILSALGLLLAIRQRPGSPGVARSPSLSR